MRTVMRLEHPSTGRGPYRFMHYHIDPMDRREQPEMDPGLGHQPGFGFSHPVHFKYGFTSVRQAEEWWDDIARESAHENGYQLAVYEAPEAVVIEDEYQCVFDPTVAKLVAHIDPKAWLLGDLNLLLQAAKEQARCAQSAAQSSPLAQTSTTIARPKPSVTVYDVWNAMRRNFEENEMLELGAFVTSEPNIQQIPRSRGQ